MTYRLQDLVDVGQLQGLLDRLHAICPFTTAILDNDGNILAAAGWQNVCTQFHRQNEQCARDCTQSDLYILSHLAEANPAVSYRCPRGLVDSATPIFVEGLHLGNFFTGQFFLEPPDFEFFREQAKRFGFEEAAYLEAVRKVPVWTQAQLDNYVFFIRELIEVIAGIGRKNLQIIQQKQEIEQREKLLNSMLEMASMGIAQADPQTGQWLRVNQKMCEITGCTPEVLLQLGARDINPAQDRQQDRERRYLRQDGTVVWLNVNRTVVSDTQEQPLQTMITVEDVSERKRTEEALRQSRDLLESIVQGTTDAVYVKDLQGRYLLVNAQVERVVCKKAADILGKDDYCLFSPEEAKVVMDGDRKVVESGSTLTYEEVVTNAAGEIHTYLSTKGPISGPNNQPIGLFGMARDITEKKRVEAALRASEQHYRSLFDNMLNGFAYCRALFEDGKCTDFVYLAVNEAFASQAGLKDVVGKKVSEVVPGIRERDPQLLDYYGRVASSGQPERFEIYVEALDRWFSVSAYSPAPEYFVSVFDVISERKRAERALRESEAHYRSLVDGTPGIVYSFSSRQGGLYYSAQLKNILGYTPEQLSSQPMLWHDSIHPDDIARVDQGIAEALAGHAYCLEYRIRDAQDQWHWLEDRSISFKSQDGETTIEGLAVDISQRKRAEEEKARLENQLQQAQKMESVGRLAGGVAHDFNNMLGVILGHTEMAMDQLDPWLPLHADLEEIHKAARRSVDLTRQLLAFARKQTVIPQVVDLNETVTGMLKMLQRLIGEDIDLQWHPAHDLWSIKVDPSQIDQVLANLCVNARDAIANIGKIIIETGNKVFDEEYCADHADCLPGEFVRLAVSDDGCGIDRQTLPHIFEPFFTTKGAGQGTGLGLATVYGAVKQNHGFIQVYSEVGNGTTFTIYLPRHADQALEVGTAGVARPIVGGLETILLVEDESAILKMTTALLKKQGYTVLAASSPSQAIELAGQGDRHIDLLITDVVMPEMNGRDLAQKLLTAYPHIRRLFMSGYTADVIAHQGVLDEGVCFLQKPFSNHDLALKVRQALTG